MAGVTFKVFALGAILATAAASPAQKHDTNLAERNLADKPLAQWPWDTSGSLSGDEPWTFGEDTAEADLGDEFNTAFAMLDLGLSDLDYNVTITTDDYAANDAIAVFRSWSVRQWDFYWVRLREDKVQLGQSMAPGLVKRQDQDWDRIIAEGEGQFEGGQGYAVRVLVTGTKLDVFVADMETPVISLTDAEFGNYGCLGMGVFKGAAKFSDISFRGI